ncbi:alpha/beta fold hydrolase [Aquincola sp. J276]|uniref:alpha/beta fold hydrolase n=1 Tax=Aquincola sp. J276 TaxID=2898432 RepID=UPI002151A995|nr:alpha/beta fold hydrolase [Aquincola sp. J276]MCR5867230.1 alpha/beta fold hydrolase [Aquincola sp. J276]
MSRHPILTLLALRLPMALLVLLATACQQPPEAAPQAPDLPMANPYGLFTEAELPGALQATIEPFWQARVRTGQVAGKGGLMLAYAAAEPAAPRASVVIVNGRTESLLKYKEVFHDLWRQGYAVYALDHRGQGLSPRLLPQQPHKGHVASFDDYVDDLAAFVDGVVRPRSAGRPLLMLAHSMGGGIGTLYLERHPGVFRAAALSSPMHAPNAKVVASATAGCLWFKATGGLCPTCYAGLLDKGFEPTPFDAQRNELTHSAVRHAIVQQAIADAPQTALGGPTRGWAAAACRASDELIAQAGRIDARLLVLQAGADTAVTPEGQAAFCAALAPQVRPSPCPLRLEGARHELLVESDRHRLPAMTAILDFFARP